TLLEDLDDLSRRYMRANQPHQVGLLPEPAKALQWPYKPALVDIPWHSAAWRDTAWRVNAGGGSCPVVGVAWSRFSCCAVRPFVQVDSTSRLVRRDRYVSRIGVLRIHVNHPSSLGRRASARWRRSLWPRQ